LHNPELAIYIVNKQFTKNGKKPEIDYDPFFNANPYTTTIVFYALKNKVILKKTFDHVKFVKSITDIFYIRRLAKYSDNFDQEVLEHYKTLVVL
jgi:hypothetical protein